MTLMNAILYKKNDNAGSHQNKGWESFTDAVIKIITKVITTQPIANQLAPTGS